MTKKCALFFLVAAVHAGPLDFGMDQIRAAMAARGIKPGLIRFKTEITTDPPESYRILPGRISGGDRRGLMYGMLEAAEQIRATGRLAQASGKPATPMRGIRCFVHNEDLEKQWYYSRDYWTAFFQMLARNRFNRFNLVFAHQTNYLAPPYPFWIEVEGFPEIRVPGLTSEQRDRNLEMLRFISQTASEYAIDFTLGIWEHNIQAGMKPTVEGITRANIGPYSYAALKKVLAACPAIRSIQMRTNSESGIPADFQVEFYRDWVYRAIREAGRLVTLDLRGWVMSKGMLDAAVDSGVPLRLSSKYWAEDLGRPYQPAETWPNYSYINFLEKRERGRRPYEFYWELWGLGSHRLLLWGDPDYVRRAVPSFTLSGSIGFEIDPPLAQKGFGNRPGVWGVFTPEQQDRVFWKWEFERYWLFYLLWGRVSYDPKTPERAWMAEMQRRFGASAPDVMDAYRNASRVLNEIVAVHLADPNMYIWPEINPGGLIEAYKEVRPSDWRYVATIHEAVSNRIGGIASAKQTPQQTAVKLDELSSRTERAIDRASAKLAGLKEWRSSESDFRVLAALARYHARKQIAADQLTEFYETAGGAALARARGEVESALKIWEGLVKLTDGVYPAEMAFGPDDIGHWKDKLPYVRHDLELIEERERIFRQFGRFDFGFDFGATPPERRGSGYRNDPYVLSNTVEPRFRPVSAATRFTEERGYGWVTEAERQDVGQPLTPYAEVRATSRNPRQLPANALLGDAVRGSGPQVFRVKTGDGEFRVQIVKPDGSAIEKSAAAVNGYVDVQFPENEWTCGGLILTNMQRKAAAPPSPDPKPVPKPGIQHFAPKVAPPGKPLALSLRIWPVSAVDRVRLHYRAVNQLAKFQTIEQPPSRLTFTIPGSDIDDKWDLMYYFEILNKEKGGWFEPDPAVTTPYHVVRIESQTAPAAPEAAAVK